MISAFAKDQERKRFGLGRSKAARRRREESKARGGRIHCGRPGDVVQMSNRVYVVANDGSFRRVDSLLAA